MDGAPSRRCATARSTKSDRATSCSLAPPRSPKACASCTRSSAKSRACRCRTRSRRSTRLNVQSPRLFVRAGVDAGLARGAVEHIVAASESGAANELEEFHARARVVAEDAVHRARHGERILLLDAAHRHAE